MARVRMIETEEVRSLRGLETFEGSKMAWEEKSENRQPGACAALQRTRLGTDRPRDVDGARSE